ncbi:MAG TPA: phosphotransferase [Candidatus Limnocylindria bacterium]|nr:phosphotransferase [Candidatus Limnocylindria bacterium]
MASRSGIDLSDRRFGLSARGTYDSRKVVFYVFSGESPQPELVIKATRTAVHNGRLENEERALRHMAQGGLVEPGTTPAVVFSGEHGGLRFLAETAVEGASLTGEAHRTGATAVYDWLIHLSATSARRDEGARSVIASGVSDIESAIGRIYPLETADRDRLRSSTQRLVEGAGRLPLVFMHGDAATWNVRLRPDGRPAFMDWEAAVADGMPLWDLFYFARSHILWGARVRRYARRPSSMIGRLLADEPLRTAVDRYSRQLEIPADLVGPLFSLCWAHRAVREVTRIEPKRLRHSHYLGLLRESLHPRVNAHWARAARTEAL